MAGYDSTSGVMSTGRPKYRNPKERLAAERKKIRDAIILRQGKKRDNKKNTLGLAKIDAVDVRTNKVVPKKTNNNTTQAGPASPPSQAKQAGPAKQVGPAGPLGQSTTTKKPKVDKKPDVTATPKVDKKPDVTAAVTKKDKSLTRNEKFKKTMADRKARLAAERLKREQAIKGYFGGVMTRSREAAAKRDADRKAKNQARKDEQKRINDERASATAEKKRLRAEDKENRPESSFERNRRIATEAGERNRKKFSTFKKGGVVKKKRSSTTKKKSIDGIAKRGKTKLKRVKG